MGFETGEDVARFIFEQWDARARAGDVDGLLELYAPDARFETPLVPVLMGTASGVLVGHDAIRPFFEEGTRRRPNELVRWHRDGTFQFNGRTLFWEYPREAPDGEQIDIAEVIDIEDGLIVHHRIYWGWFGVAQLERSPGRRPKTAG